MSIEPLVDICRAMHAESPVYNRFGFDEPHVRSLLKICMDNGWVIIEYEGDEIAAMMTWVESGLITDSQHKQAVDFFIYVSPKYRRTGHARNMLKRFEEQCKADMICLGAGAGIDSLAADLFFKSCGYTDTYTVYRKIRNG